MARGIHETSFLGHHAYNRPSPVVGGSVESLKGFKNLVKNPEVLATLAVQSASNKSTSPTDGTTTAAKNSPSPTRESDDATTTSLNATKKITHEEAVKATGDVMSAFYSHMFKSLFAEIVGDDESHSYGMVKELFVEQLAQSLGKNQSPTHDKLVNAMMLNQTDSSDATDGEGITASPEDDNAAAATIQQTVDNQATFPSAVQTAAHTWPLLAPPPNYWGAHTPKIREAVHVLA